MWKPVDAFRIKNMLLSSFQVIFLALTPVVMRGLGLSERTVWRTALLVLAVATLLGSALSVVRGLKVLSHDDRRILNPTLVGLVLAALVVSAIAETVTALASGAAAPGVFLAGLLVLFGFSVYLIVRFLFARPGAG